MYCSASNLVTESSLFMCYEPCFFHDFSCKFLCSVEINETYLLLGLIYLFFSKFNLHLSIKVVCVWQIQSETLTVRSGKVDANLSSKLSVVGVFQTRWLLLRAHPASSLVYFSPLLIIYSELMVPAIRAGSTTKIEMSSSAINLPYGSSRSFWEFGCIYSN